jgi:tripeptide aminopeptidase
MNTKRLINTFLDLITIYSPSLQERYVCDYLTRRLEDLGFEVNEDLVGEQIGGNSGNLYGYLKGDESLEPLLFCAHMDTVEPARGKKVIMHDNGMITSDGKTILGSDAMSGVSAILEAISTIKEEAKNHRPIEVLFCVAEEIYGLGSKFFDYNVIKSKESYTLDLSGDVGSAAFKAPSLLTFDMIVEGKSGHSNFKSDNTINAIIVASNAVSQLKTGKIDTRSTLNIGLIQGGRAPNIIPDLCAVKGEIRSFSNDETYVLLDEVIKLFTRVTEEYGAKLEVSYEMHIEAYETPLNHPVVMRFQEVCEKLDIKCKLCSTFGGSDNNNIEQHGIKGLVLASAMNSCHSNDEYTSVSELERITEVTIELMKGEIKKPRKLNSYEI